MRIYQAVRFIWRPNRSAAFRRSFAAAPIAIWSDPKTHHAITVTL
jgi:hypothetical protein